MRAENAIEGFERARLLLPSDREMAAFRAITAEEEAAAALFVSLRMRKYPGANQLNLYSHQQKAALWPFLDAVKLSIVGREGKLSVQMTLDAKKPSLTISVMLSELGVKFPGSETLCLQLAQPLGLLGVAADGGSPTDFFDKHIAKVASAANVTRIQQFINDQANVRNKLLYASDSKLPTSQATEETIERRQKRADTALLLSIAVLQVKSHQQMAKQCLAAFLKMVGRAMAQEPDFRRVEPDIVINARRKQK